MTHRAMNPLDLSALLRSLARSSMSSCGSDDRPDRPACCACERVISCSEALACLGERAPGDDSFEPKGDEPADITAWLDALASVERASVSALEALTARLVEHGAPAHLIEAARVATAEMRHETWRA